MKYLYFIALCLIQLSSFAITAELFKGKTVQLLDMSHITTAKYAQMQALPFNTADYQGAADAGMSNVPVLDQGQYGTCVTFATTAALDARFDLGDYISQQCFLQLSKTLGNDIWNGAYTPSEVIDPLKKHGVVSHEKCPVKYPSPSSALSVAQYEKLADKQVSGVVSGVKYTYYSKNDLAAVKAAVLAKKRVLIGFLVNPNKAMGFDLPGKRGGLWSCSASAPSPDPEPTPEPSEYEKCLEMYPGFEDFCEWVYGGNDFETASECGKFNAGHEVLIYGFDDVSQRLKIRNSWGKDVGEKGDWYMSYEYFSKQVLDQTVIE